MLTQAGCVARRQRLWDSVPLACEWLLIADPRHVLYLPLGAFELLGLDHEQHSVKTETKDLGKPGAVDLGTTIRSLRRQKHEDEIALLKECMRAGEAGMVRLREIIRPGISEFEIFCEVQHAAIAAAGRPGLIYGDFRAATAAKPKVGGLPTHHKLEPGDMFTLDYSVVLDGYRSDFTNCMTVGEPNSQQRHLYDLVSAAQRSGESVLKAGTRAKDVFIMPGRGLDWLIRKLRSWSPTAKTS